MNGDLEPVDNFFDENTASNFEITEAITYLENKIKGDTDKIDQIREKLLHIFDKAYFGETDGVLQLCREINTILESLEDK